MLSKLKSNKRGFTIIEVVLVLAIAALIFLMVFLALPALNRSQRDTQRRNDMGEFRTQIVQYQSNNRGKVPGGSTSGEAALEEWENFLEQYMDLGLVTDNEDADSGNDEHYLLKEDANATDIPFTDPDGEPYYIGGHCDMKNETACNGITGSTALTWDANKHEIFVYNNATCEGENAVAVDKSSTRSVAFRYKLEGAGTYCGNN